MPFPSFRALTRSVVSAATQHPVAVPSLVSGGDMLLWVVGGDGANPVTFPPGFTEVHDTSDLSLRFSIAYKMADGSEQSTTLTALTTTLSTKHHLLYVVRDWATTAAPEFSTSGFGQTNVTAPAHISAMVPSWGSADNLWVSLLITSVSARVCSYPTLYTQQPTAVGTRLFAAGRQLATGSHLAGAFSIEPSANTYIVNGVIKYGVAPPTVGVSTSEYEHEVKSVLVSGGVSAYETDWLTPISGVSLLGAGGGWVLAGSAAGGTTLSALVSVDHQYVRGSDDGTFKTDRLALYFDPQLPYGFMAHGFEIRYTRHQLFAVPSVATVLLQPGSAPRDGTTHQLFGNNASADTWSGTVDVDNPDLASAGSDQDTWGLTTAQRRQGPINSPTFCFIVQVSAVGAASLIDYVYLNSFQLKIHYQEIPPNTTDVVTPEFDHEIRSVGVIQTSFFSSTGMTSEYDHEIRSVQPVTNIEALDCEYDHEIANVSLVVGFAVNNGEYDHEITSVDITQVHIFAAGEIDSSEYDHELQSVSLVFTSIFSMGNSSLEFDHEIQGNIEVEVLRVNQYEHEIMSVALSKNIGVFTNEYGHEMQSIWVLGDPINFQRLEFDHEISSVFIRNFGPSKTMFIKRVRQR